MRRSTSLQGCSSASPAFGFDAVPGSLYPPPAAMSSLLCAPGVISILRRQLGRLLFFDPRLTIDSNISCSSCHQPAFYGTDALPKGIGVKQRPHPRHVPTNLNAGTSFVIHWRGDRTNLEDQVFQALTSPITSGQPDGKAVIDRLAGIPGYAPLFKAACPDEPQPMTLRNIAKAVGAYERTLVTPSPFDA